MFFSFLTRFISAKPQQPTLNEQEENTALKILVIKEGGKFFQNFKLFHREEITSIDTLIFFPHFGIFLGETVNWKASELENTTVERSSRQKKVPSVTHLEKMESKIRSKLQDVLSFDFTPVQRFIWMKNLTESEFDKLDPSFHELLPKTRLLFNDDSVESIKIKLHALGKYLQEPLSSLKIIGALNAHACILPSRFHPEGALLSFQQNDFLRTPLRETTTLYGGYGSGKSTLLIRKAMVMLLENSEEKLLVLAPTLLASELLRDEFVSLMDHASLSIDLTRITFSFLPESFSELKNFNDATTVFCDDSDLMDTNCIHSLIQKRGKRLLLLTAISDTPLSENTIHLTHCYRNAITPRTLHCFSTTPLYSVLLELRKRLIDSASNEIGIVFSEPEFLVPFKEAIDEYLRLDCRILTRQFSLQSQNLDNLILATADSISGISLSHLILVASNDLEDYTYPLSRASETATIISYSKS